MRQTLWFVSRNSNGLKKSVTVWELGTGGQDTEDMGHKRAQGTRDNRHVRQQTGAEMVMVAIFFGRTEVRRRAPGAVRCTAPS